MVIIPLDEQAIQQYCGRIVYLETRDGQCYLGRLSSCQGGRLMLNADAQPAVAYPQPSSPTAKQTALKAKKPKTTSLKKRVHQARTNATVPYQFYHPYSPYGPPVILDLAFISLLLLLFI